MARVALVTGGKRGIGAAISTALKAAGFTVAANYGGNDEAAKAFSDETGIAAYKFDVGDFTAVQAGVAQIEVDLGPVEVLVNNAGITRDTMLHRMDEEKWGAVIRTNLDSAYHLTRSVIEGMRERGWGRIVNISSINGLKGQLGQSNYAAAKAGLIGFTKSVAQENARKPGPPRPRTTSNSPVRWSASQPAISWRNASSSSEKRMFTGTPRAERPRRRCARHRDRASWRARSVGRRRHRRTPSRAPGRAHRAG